MTKRKVKKSVVYTSYCIGLIMIIGLIYLVEASIPKKHSSKDKYNYVSKTIFDDIVPVVNTDDKLIKPYTATDVEELKKYYDYKSEEAEQEKSIIYYENTYMQSNGITYGKETPFDVVAVLPGTVEEIKNDELLGQVVTIKHSDNLKSIYQCLSKVSAKKGDSVIQGQVIGQSGPSNLNKDKENVLYFELILNNISLNPNNYYNKTIEEIK